MPSGRKTKVKPAPTVSGIRDRAILNICSSVNRVISVHERRIGTSDDGGLTMSAYDEISSGSGAYEGNEDLKETVQELGKQITIRRRKQVVEAKEKEERVQAQATRRRGGMRGSAITNGLVSILDLRKKQRDERWMGFDATDFFRFDMTIVEALKRTSVLMLKMLSIVAVASFLNYGIIRVVRLYIQAANDDDATTSSESTHAASVEILTLAFGTCEYFLFGLGSLFTGLRLHHALISAMMYPIACTPIFFLSSRISGIFLSVFITVYGGVAILPTPYFMVTGSARENDVAAAKSAERNRAGAAEEVKKKGAKEIIKFMAFVALPIIFVFAVILIYTLIIFRLFRLVDSSLWMLAVTILAQAVKIVGNKMMLSMLKNLSEHTDPWYFEMMLFFYEQTTALLCRVLQLSIDDRDTAIFCSVFGAIAEMAVRVFYFQLFLSHGLKKDGQWDSDEEIYNYALRGKLRAQDSSNDMIVEYLSSITGALYLIELQKVDSFQFASDKVVEASRVWSIVLVQLLPEFPIDFFVTFLEIFGGLALVHEANWSHKTGVRQVKTNFWLDLGDFVKGLVCKLLVSCVMCVAILIYCLK